MTYWSSISACLTKDGLSLILRLPTAWVTRTGAHHFRPGVRWMTVCEGSNRVATITRPVNHSHLPNCLQGLRNLVKRNSSSVAEAARLRVLDLGWICSDVRASRGGEILNFDAAGIRSSGIFVPKCGPRCPAVH